MSNSFYVSIKIGGTLEKKFGNGLVNILDELSDSQEVPTEENLITMNLEPIECNGFCDAYIAEKIMSFCKEHDLTCVIHASHSEECEAEIIFIAPGMEKEREVPSDDSSNPMVFSAVAKPLLNILIDYCLMGDKALPLHINDEMHGDLVKDILKTPDQFEKLVKAKVKTLMPDIPNVPPFALTVE